MKLIVALLIALAPTIPMSVQSVSDDFNLPDGPVGDGWNTIGTAYIAGQELVTLGQYYVGGGIFRSQQVTFPLTFSFDFRTDSPTNGGWGIHLNHPDPSIAYPGGTFSVHQWATESLMFTYMSSAGLVQRPIPFAAQEYGSTFSHISGAVNGDLSAVITITYFDSTHVTIVIPTPADAVLSPPGSYLVFGNVSGLQGPHYFDNLQIDWGMLPAQALADAIRSALGTRPGVDSFLAQAAAISSAPNANAKRGRLRSFINHVNAQRGKTLTDAQANQLIALAQAV